MKTFEILLIDDNEIDNYISKYMIESTGLASKITEKTSAINALAYLNEIKRLRGKFPKIIFLDIQMPKMDGFEFLNKLSEFHESMINSCDVIMLSSSLDPNDEVRAMQNPFVKYFLSKPLTSEVVENVIINHCNFRLDDIYDISI